MSQDLRRSPLAHRTPISDANGQISLAEQPFIGLLTLRGQHGRVANAVKSIVGLDLPDTVGRFADSGENAAMWLGPDEWVIFTSPGTELDVMSALTSALEGVHSQVVNVTDYYTALAIGGAKARDVLAKITMVDLHSRSFSKGHAVSSLFGHAGAWLQMMDDETGAGPEFALYVRRSMADYLWCLIADGGREFGLERQEPIGRVKLHLPHFETA